MVAYTSSFSSQAIEFLADAVTSLKLTSAANSLSLAGANNAHCTLSGVETCTTEYQAANKKYVDAVAQGLSVKESVICAATENVVLANLKVGDVLNGVTMAAGHRVLLRAQTNAVENGIYVIRFGDVPVRAADMPVGSSAASAFCFSQSGTQYADAGFVCTSDAPAIVGTHPLTWVQFSQAGVIEAGTNLNKSGNYLNLDADIELTSVTLGNLALSQGSITDTSGAISFGSTSLSTTGNVSAAAVTGTSSGTFGDLTLSGHTIEAVGNTIAFGSGGSASVQADTYNGSEVQLGNLALSQGSITDASGAISFGSTNLSTTGDVSAAAVTGTSSGTFGDLTLSGHTIEAVGDIITLGSGGSASVQADTYNGSEVLLGNLALSQGSITDASGAISFGSTSLSTTGNVSASAVTGTSGATFGNISLASGSITDSSNAISFGSAVLSAASYTSSSDARLKTNIQLIEAPLDKVRTLRGVSFDWIASEAHDVGVIAQDVEAAMPALVHFDDAGYRRVDYPKLVALLIEAVKTLDAQVQRLDMTA
jgi:hypothetical protein